MEQGRGHALAFEKTKVTMRKSLTRMSLFTKDGAPFAVDLRLAMSHA
jgi:hypothetical protein